MAKVDEAKVEDGVKVEEVVKVEKVEDGAKVEEVVKVEEVRGELAGPLLLGRSRAAIEAVIGGPLGREGAWVRYDGVALRYDGERCVGLVRFVPAGLGCAEAAAWMGYPDAGGPLWRGDRCEWPGISPRHRLADGVAATLVFAGGRFEVRLR